MTLPGLTYVITVSSGSVQAFSSGATLLSTAGITQVYNVSTAGAVGPVTSSAGVLANVSSGIVSLSSQISVTATAATNPWSSAPGFNVPTVSVSSGLVQIQSSVSSTGVTFPLFLHPVGLCIQTSPITAALTSGQIVPTQGDRYGRTVVALGAGQDRWFSATLSASSTAATAILAAPGAGISAVLNTWNVTQTSTVVASNVVQLLGGAALIQTAFFTSGLVAGANNFFEWFPGYKVAANTAINANMSTAASQVIHSISGFYVSSS